MTDPFAPGQHLLWAEQSSPNNMDPVIWPRAASSAEVSLDLSDCRRLFPYRYDLACTAVLVRTWRGCWQSIAEVT